jgi:hypothetical protein
MSDTTVAIEDGEFLINGRPTYEGRTHDGHRVEGLLFNARMIQALFDDATPETRGRWAYPDTGGYDPERNVREFRAAIPAWRAHGLRAVTVNLQCGSPEGYSDEQPWTVSAYRPDGSLKPAWRDRLERVLDAADANGLVVILGLFYFGQDGVLEDETAVRRAVTTAVDLLLDRGDEHVLIEVNNECDIRYDHPVLRPDRVPELIRFVRERSGGRFPVGTSFSGGTVPTDGVVAASDLLLLHGNGVSDPDRIGEMVREARSRPSYAGEPVVFNEDDHFGFREPPSNASVALAEHASWGYFDPGRNNYRDGYQSPPVEWSINTPRKRAFFEWVAEVTGTDPGGHAVADGDVDSEGTTP